MALSYRKAHALARGVILASVLAGGQVHALAPEHEIQRLMLATDEAVAAENWEDAGDYLNRLQQLEGKKPADYFYYRGRVMLQAGLLNEAQSALETYVEQQGAEGRRYKESLQLITSIEKKRKEQALTAAGANTDAGKIAVIEPAGEQNIAALRKLYLVNSDREALTLHLNSLLEVAGWHRDQTIVDVNAPADIEYRISSEDSAIVIQEIRRSADDKMVRKSQQLSVYGVNPMVEWSCEAAVGACWIYDPRDGSRLLQLAPGRDQAREIAGTLGQLIRNLQTLGGS